jgi:hypothetical protein
MLVTVLPGATALTRILKPLNSTARYWTIATCAALVAP